MERELIQMTSARRPLNKGLLIALIVVIAFIPKILSSVYKVNDAFIYLPLAVAQVSLDQDHLITNPFEFKGGTLQWGANAASGRMAPISILVIISRVTGLSLEAIHTLPINGIILFVLGYALARHLLRSNWLILAFTLFISYEPVTISLANTVLSVGWGYTLYFTFALLIVKTLKQRGLTTRLIPLLFLIFVTTYLTYYTAEAYMIILSLGITLLLLTERRILRVKSLQKYPNLSSLSVALVVFFAGFDTIFYSYLRQISSANLGEFIMGYMEYVSDMLTGEAYTGVQSATVSRLTLYSGMAVYISLAVPILLYLAHLAVTLIKKVHNSENINVDLRLVVFLMLLATGVINVLIYAGLSVMGYKYILLVYPLLAFYSLEHLEMAQVKKLVIMVLIVILCVTKFSAYCLDTSVGYADSYYSYINPTATWVSRHLDNGDILTDLKTGGNLLFEEAKAGKANQVQISMFTENNVSFLYPGNMGEANVVFQRWGYDYLVTSHRYGTQSVVGANWLGVKLSEDVLQRLDSYSGFYKVFDDSHGIVYKFAGGG